MATRPTTPSQSQLLHILAVVVVLLVPSALLIQEATAIAQAQDELPSITLPGCPDKCGNISIPFPFGMKPGCFREGFQVTCDHSFQPPRAFLSYERSGQQMVSLWVSKSSGNASTVGLNASGFSPVELIDVSISSSQARVHGAVASACNTNNATEFLVRLTFASFALETAGEGPAPPPKLQGPFLVSPARNVLVGVGVEAQPAVYKLDDWGTTRSYSEYLASCRSDLVGKKQLELASNGSCSGQGCCQASLPEAPAFPLTGVSVVVPTRQTTLNNDGSATWVTSPCSLGMVVEKSWYSFSTADLYGDTVDKFPRGVPYVIDFAIRNAKCPAEDQQPPFGYACVSGNSTCVDVTNGYVCRCLEHYEGNPYIPNGCQDIDECKLPDLYPCSSHGICKNRLLGYDCPCKPGMKGDGKKGTCQDVFPLVAKMIVGVIGGFFVLAALLFLILLRREKKKMKQFFEKNGGPILEKAKLIKIFKKEELKEILKDSNLIGKGNFGEVYKGLLDNKIVVVKKPINGSALENEQFANEVIVQSQVIHKNIVRLIGCCLEVDIPMLVYEFIPRGNLEDILHNNNNVVPLDLDVRLSIAAHSADGLAYMHSKTNHKFLHGDVKPANILLDDNFMPKISDFGISRLIARDKEHTDEVIGDMTYMDPIYRQTGLLTEKSDVYSFGVVILELISRKKATYRDNNSLVRNFLEAHKKEERLNELFDNEIAQANNLDLLHSLTRIAVECLNLEVDQRPSMTVVAEHLLLLIRTHSS